MSSEDPNDTPGSFEAAVHAQSGTGHSEDVHGYSYCVPGEGVAIPPTYTVPPLPHFHYPHYLHHTSYPQPAPYTPCPSPIPVQPIYYPPPPSPAPAPNVSANSTARSTPSPSTNASEHVRQLIAASFGATVFKKVPLPSVNPTKPHLWYLQSTVEARLWVILNCIKAAGFKSFGEFLVAMFSGKHSSHPTVIKTVSSFVRGDSKAGTRPVDVVRLLYENPHSGKLRTPSAGDIVFPSLPRHALPPALRLLEAPDVPESSTTRNDLLDWALARVLVRVDEEVKILLDPLHGIASRTQAVTWSMLYSYSLTEKQDVIARNAPALFAVIASAATSEDAREKLRLSVSGRLAETDSSRAGPSQPNTELPQGESGVADEDETDPPVVGSTRDIWLGITVAILILLAFRYRFANIFQKFVAVILFSNNVPRTVYQILCRVGLCISYSATLCLLEELGQGQSEVLKEWGKSVATGMPDFQLIFDNINKAHRVWQKTLAAYDDLQSGTAGALIKLEDVPPGAFNRQALEDHMKAHPRSDLSLDELEADIDWDHIDGIGYATVMRIWTRWIPALAVHRVSVERLFSETYQKHRLRLRKTQLVTLRCSNIDESTSKGTDEVLRDVFLRQLCLLPMVFETVFLFICGDQLTIDRVRKLVWHVRKAGTVFNRRIWTRPTIQLWHAKWAWQKAIVKLHWFEGTEKGTYGLHRDARTLGRHKYNPVKCDFYPTHHLLNDCFETMVLDALRLLCEEETGVIHDKKTTLLTSLRMYFAADGPMKGCSFETLTRLSKKVYDRYMCLAAYDDAFGYTDRDTSLYGPSAPPQTPEHYGDNENNTSSTECRSTTGAASSQRKKSKRRAEPEQFAAMGGYKGDQSMINTTSFMRTVFWYMEFCAGVAEGDIGRVIEILKLLRFSFWGAGSSNYGNEMLELACHLLRDYPEPTRIALLNNYLVNPSGLPGHWHEGDLLMEHLNNWLKNLLVKKTMDFDSPFMKNTIALNLSGFQALREVVPKVFGLKSTSGYHPDADRSKDINQLGAQYRAVNLLRFTPGRRQAYEVVNEFRLGYEKLRDGQLATFLSRTAATSVGFDAEMDTVGSVPDGFTADAEVDINMANTTT